jgi:predicted ATPase/class 3 adenylate cyclase
MRCPECQADNIETANFCNVCGLDLRAIKTNYRDTNNPPASYTPKHLAEKILTSRSAIEGEHKYVTVMFVDVANSTAVFEDVDPETVHQIMNGCFQIFLDEVHRYEGTINQFRGDCVMAIFGAPIAHEDHAQRACYAALGIMRAMQGYSEAVKRRHKIPFEVRIGLNTGPVVVGSIGDDLRMDYTADGDTSNLASRMESNARPGTILISPNTYKIVGRLFKIKSVGKISVKGKKDRLDVYELLDEKIDRPRVGIERQIYSDLVGRDKELHRMEQQVIKVVNGSGAVVNIIGEAGIGKSRLVAELKKQNLMDQVTLLEGKAISIGQNLSFHPIIDLLKQWARIKDEDDNQTAFDKLENMIESICTEETAEILPFIATLMGIKLTGRHAQRLKGIEGEALENLVFKNFRELLIQAAKSVPVVVIIEDLHWADLSSLWFLASVFRLAASQRILFINAIRPGYEETGERIIRTLSDDLKTNYVEIRLEQLDVRSSETLINNMLKIKGLPISVIRQIVSRSDGNPYFIEEVVRSFIDEGVVVVKDGAFEAGDKINKVVIPNTINDLLMARIDRLEEKNRELIKTASVIGRNFFYRILKGVAASIEDIDLRLSYLKNIQLILERQRLDEIEYLFTHALAQEAAYASILIEKRKSLHLEVAKAIENVFSDNIRDFYGVLSYHYLNGEDFARAEEYLIKSGEEALNSSASSEAITYFKEALRLYQDRLGKTADPDKIIYLEKSIALAYYNKGQLLESIEYFDKVLPYYGIKTSKNAIFSASQAVFCFISFVINLYFPSLRSNKKADINEVEILELWWKRSSAYSISNRIMFVKEGFRLFRHLSNYNLKTIKNGVRYIVGATALFSYGGISFALGEKVLSRVKPDVEEDDPRDTLYYIMFKMLHEFFCGNITEDLKYDEKLVADNLKFGDVLFTSYYSIHHIFRKIEKGNFKDAIYVIQKLSELIEAYRCDYAKSNLYYVNARILLKTRKLVDALNAAEDGIVYESKAGDLLVLSQIYSIKSRMQILTGDIEGAEQSLVNAEKVGTGIMPPLYSSEIYLSRFLLQLSKFENILNGKDKDQISEYSRKAIKAGKKAARCTKKAVYNSVEVHKYIGVYYWITNKQKMALKYWKKSITIGKNAGTKPELARTYFEVGKRLSDKKSTQKELKGIKAEEYLEKAKAMFEDLDLKWDLDNLTKLRKNDEKI